MNRVEYKEKLTPKQTEIYNSIKIFLQENDYSPSVRELCSMCNVSSPATMFVHLKKMKKKGFIDFIERKSRTIRIMKES